MWSGSLSFGLVNVPINVFNTTEEKEFSFKQLCPQHLARIKHKNVCELDGQEVSYQDIKKGFELVKDQYIVIEKAELDQIKLDSNKNIEIKEFVNLSELDLLLIGKSYYVTSNSKLGNNKGFQLLARILHDSNKIGIGQIVIKDREQIVAVRYYQNNCLMIHVLRYLDEIRPTDEIPDVNSDKIKLEAEELNLAKMLVDKYTTKHLDLTKYEDEYTKELRHLIEAKSKGETITVKDEIKPKAQMDLMEALKSSLEVSLKPKIEVKNESKTQQKKSLNSKGKNKKA